MKDQLIPLSKFPIQTTDKLRYADTDRQGHVNNAVFATFLETGRVELLYSSTEPITSKDQSFVITNLNINFIKEIHWPGSVSVGSAVVKLGNSSVQFYQQIHQKDICVASAITTIVQVDTMAGKSSPLSAHARSVLGQYLIES